MPSNLEGGFWARVGQRGTGGGKAYPCLVGMGACREGCGAGAKGLGIYGALAAGGIT